jgi:hypothetical protein
MASRLAPRVSGEIGEQVSSDRLFNLGRTQTTRFPHGSTRMMADPWRLLTVEYGDDNASFTWDYAGFKGQQAARQR